MEKQPDKTETPAAAPAPEKPKRKGPPRDPVTNQFLRRDGTKSPARPKPAAAAAAPAKGGDDGWKWLLAAAGLLLLALTLANLRKPKAPPAAA